jgi:hypothetical protein
MREPKLSRRVKEIGMTIFLTAVMCACRTSPVVETKQTVDQRAESFYRQSAKVTSDVDLKLVRRNDLESSLHQMWTALDSIVIFEITEVPRPGHIRSYSLPWGVPGKHFVATRETGDNFYLLGAEINAPIEFANITHDSTLLHTSDVKIVNSAQACYLLTRGWELKTYVSAHEIESQVYEDLKFREGNESRASKETRRWMKKYFSNDMQPGPKIQSEGSNVVVTFPQVVSRFGPSHDFQGPFMIQVHVGLSNSGCNSTEIIVSGP